MVVSNFPSAHAVRILANRLAPFRVNVKRSIPGGGKATNSMLSCSAITRNEEAQQDAPSDADLSVVCTE